MSCLWGLPVGAVLLEHLRYNPGASAGELEAGSHLGRACWVERWATEMPRGALAHGFDHQGDPVISAVTETTTSRSVAMLEPLGMDHRRIARAYLGTRVRAL